MKVIIVDDDKVALRGLTKMINWEACHGEVVGTATNGTDAVLLIKKHKPDVVLSDIQMPGLDGLGLARYVHEYYPSTRIILISGHGEFEYAQQAIKYQVVDYILKPITRDKIRDIEERLREFAEESNREKYALLQAGDTDLQALIMKYLEASDDEALDRILHSETIRRAIGQNRQDSMGIQLINYLYNYLISIGRDSELLQELKYRDLEKYWSFDFQAEKIAFLSERYREVALQVKARKGSFDDPIIIFADRYMKEHFTDTDFNVSALADQMNLSLSYVSTVYKQNTGNNLSKVLRDLRMEKAKELLLDITLPVSEVSYRSGYEDARYFAKFFKSYTRMTPSEYRNIHAGENTQ